MRVRAFRKVLVGSIVLVGAVTLTGTTLSACGRRNNSSAESSPSSSATSSAGTASPAAVRQQVTLPIKGGRYFYPSDVAVDTQGTVYVTATNEGVLKLAPGAQAAVSVGFTELNFAVSGGADTAGNVYVSDNGGKGTGGIGRVQKRTPAGAQTELPFGGFGEDSHLAVAPDGTVYVADSASDRVLKLPPGATSPSTLQFTGLKAAHYVAVDSAGNVYLTEGDYRSDHQRVLMLAAGSTAQTVLPISARKQRGVAVDGSGNVYVAGAQGVTVLAKGSQTTTQLPVSGLSGPGDGTPLLGIAVDSRGNVYLADHKNKQVVELKV